MALIEIILGVLGGNFLGVHTTPWIDYLAGFGSIVLTFLAGAEVDTDVLREEFAASLLIGGLSFLLPFLGAWGMVFWVLHWAPQAAKIAGVALSTTSLAVVYAVLVETTGWSTTSHATSSLCGVPGKGVCHVGRARDRGGVPPR